MREKHEHLIATCKARGSNIQQDILTACQQRMTLCVEWQRGSRMQGAATTKMSSHRRLAYALRFSLGGPAAIRILRIEAARAVAMFSTGWLPATETSTALFGTAFQIQRHLQPAPSTFMMAAAVMSLP